MSRINPIDLRSLPQLFVPEATTPHTDLSALPGPPQRLVSFLSPATPLLELVRLLTFASQAFLPQDPVLLLIHLPEPEQGEALLQAALAQTGLTEAALPEHLLFHVEPWEYPAVLAASQGCLSLSEDLAWNQMQVVQSLAMNRPCLSAPSNDPSGDPRLERLPLIAVADTPRESALALLNPPRVDLRAALLAALDLAPTQLLSLERIDQTDVLLIYFWGRSGSYFIQSLLDAHPETLSTPTGALKLFHEAWDSQLSRLLQSNPQVGLPDMLDFFMQNYPVLFEASPDTTFSNLDKMGPNRDQVLRVDGLAFKRAFIGLYEVYVKGRKTLDRRLFFLLLHWAYELAQGRDIAEKHLLVYQVHRPDLNRANAEVLLDFPQARALGMVREPLRGLHSHLRMRVFQAQNMTEQENERGFSSLNGETYDFADTVSEGFYLSAYHHQLTGWKPLLQRYGIELYRQKLEALHAEPEAEMRKLAEWLKINWHPCLLQSSFNGLAFWGDVAAHRPINGFSREQTQSAAWEAHFSRLDREVLYALLETDLQEQGYGSPFPFVKMLLPLLIFWPTRLEQQAFELAIQIRNQAACETIFLNLIKRWLVCFAALFGREI